MRRAVVVDDADLIVAEAVDPVLVEVELRILDQEVADLGLAEVEDLAAGMISSVEVERILRLALGRGLAVEEEQALIAELSARVVVDDVEEDRQAVDVAEIDERLELVH